MWLIKSLRPPQYREPLLERFGFVKKQPTKTVWFHAVSMGESKGAISIIRELRKTHKDLDIVVTTTTKTGARQITQALGDTVQHFYSPCDLPGSIKRFVSRINPKLLVILETELWPNWMNHLSKTQIPVVLANARLSESSARKYGKIRKLFSAMMEKMSIVLPVNVNDAARFIELGLSEDKCQVTGNIKYDQAVPSLALDSFYTEWAEHQVSWIAASTHKGEDEIVLAAHKKIVEVIPDCKLILVPRHPERFEQVAELIQQDFLLARRSQPELWNNEAEVLLGDTMGEMMLAYAQADIAFVGGSLVDVGGHNAIEPAILGKPVLSGRIVYNFQEVFDLLEQAGGAEFADTAESIAEKVMVLIRNAEQRKVMGARALEVISNNRGALSRTADAIRLYLSE